MIPSLFFFFLFPEWSVVTSIFYLYILHEPYYYYYYSTMEDDHIRPKYNTNIILRLSYVSGPHKYEDENPGEQSKETITNKFFSFSLYRKQKR